MRLLLQLRPTSFTRIRSFGELIDGKKLSQNILTELQREVKESLSTGALNRAPKLVAVLANDIPQSRSYIKIKFKAAKKAGIEVDLITLPQSTSQRQIIDIVHDLNNDDNTDGILVQLPLYDHLADGLVCDEISPMKDVDGVSTLNLGRFCRNDPSAFIPCTALAVHHMITNLGLPTKGKHAVVLGRSKHVGLPIAIMLQASQNKCGFNGCEMTTTICHRHTPKEQLKELCSMADFIVSAAGVPCLITPDMVANDAVVVDVGMTQVKDEELNKHIFVGDVEFSGVRNKAKAISPVPGGVGPVTVAMLMKNTVKSALLLHHPKT